MEQLDQAQEATQQEAQAPISLTLQDLRIMAGAIELGAQRGAFRAPEMEIIGATYNKLATFLKVNAPEEAPAEEAPTEASAEVTGE